MAAIPAGASLLFGALADSGRIRQRKNSSYRMILKGVDEINWYTDKPYRAEGRQVDTMEAVEEIEFILCKYDAQ